MAVQRAMKPVTTGVATSRTDLWDNPMGTDGFEFVEYTAPDPAALGRLFETMGFAAVARHRSKNVTLYRQGDVNFIVNAEPEILRARFRPRARAVGLRYGLPRRGRSLCLQTRARAGRQAASSARSGRWS